MTPKGPVDITAARPIDPVADSEIVKDLWNAKVNDPKSCWTVSTPEVSKQFIELMNQKFSVHVEDTDGVISGFGFWRGDTLHGICADTPEVYYKLFLIYVQEALDSGIKVGTGIVQLQGGDQEKKWMDALGVIEYTPHAYIPIVKGQNESERVPVALLAQADLEKLRTALENVTTNPTT